MRGRASGRRDPRLLFGAAVLGLFALGGLLAPWIAPHDPAASLGRAEFSLVSPRPGLWLGTDVESRDVLSRLLHGARASLATALAATALATALGAAAGLAAGARRGATDFLLMRLAEFFSAIPGIVILLASGAILGPSQATLVFLLAATGWMGTARLVRAEVVALREREFVLAARGLGFPWRTVAARHVLPHVAAPVAVSAALGLGSALVAEAVVSFLGFGVPEPGASWGKMVHEGIDRMREGWWVSLFPAIAIGLCVCASVLLAEALREGRRR